MKHISLLWQLSSPWKRGLTVVFVAMVAAARFTPVYPQFCHSVDRDCHEKTPFDRLRWNTSVSHLILDLEQFKVSSKKLVGKRDFLIYVYCVYLQIILSINTPTSTFSLCRSISH